MKSKIKITFFITIVSSFWLLLVAQQDAQYTNYMYNTQLIQPAYVGSRGITSITALARTQWVDLNGAPETATISFETPLGNDENMGLGFSVISDKIGPTAENTISVDYSYSLNFIWSKLTFGLKAGINDLEIDYSKLNIADLDDPLLRYNAKKIKPRIGLGIYFNTDQYYLGFSAPNILQTKFYDQLRIENTSFSEVASRIHYYGIFGYVFNLTDKIKAKPATLVKVVKGAPVQWDLSMNLLINYKLTLGIANRLDSAMSLLGGLQLTDNLFIGLSYDYMSNNLRSLNDGSYEIVLKLDIFGSQGKILTPRFF